MKELSIMSHIHYVERMSAISKYRFVYFTTVQYICQVKKENFMNLGKMIAQNLKQLRTERNLSLGDLAKASGISKAMLSDIEKGNSNPTINTIWKIANGLKVSYTKLIDSVDREATVVRKPTSVMQLGESQAYRVYCYYKTSPVRNFEFFYVELDAQSSNYTIGHSEKAQEYIYVIKGELILQTELENFVLQEGDSLVFDSFISHTYKNRQDFMISFIVINFYPNA